MEYISIVSMSSVLSCSDWLL